MRRFALSLSGLAFLWTCGATVHLLFASSEAGITTSAMLSANGNGSHRVMPPLATAPGVWMTGLLMGITVLAGMPLGLALTHPTDQRTPAWTAAALMLGFCAVSGWSVGLPFLPSVILLILAGTVGRVVEPRDMGLPDLEG